MKDPKECPPYWSEIGIGAATELPHRENPTFLKKLGQIAERIVFGPHYRD